MRIRALTIWQPWAELIMRGEKLWETRFWDNVPVRIVGQPLAIHAGKVKNETVRYDCQSFDIDPDTLTYGAILGTVHVPEVRRLTTEDSEAALCVCNGKVGIGCEYPIWLLKPLPWKGTQGFFWVDIPDDLVPESHVRPV